MSQEGSGQGGRTKRHPESQQFREGCSRTRQTPKKACRTRRAQPIFLTTFTAVFRVLLRRLGLPLPLTARFCRCGHPVRGHHRATGAGGHRLRPIRLRPIRLGPIGPNCRVCLSVCLSVCLLCVCLLCVLSIRISRSGWRVQK